MENGNERKNNVERYGLNLKVIMTFFSGCKQNKTKNKINCLETRKAIYEQGYSTKNRTRVLV